MSGNNGKFIDRNPIICAAGKQNITLETVENLLKIYTLDDKIDALKNLYNISNKSTFEYKLPVLEDNRNAGYFTRIRKLVQPEPISGFEEFENEIHESIYESAKNKPLGKPRKNIAKPDNITNISRTFGISVERSPSIYGLIFPNKTPCEVLTQSQQGHENYKKTHNDYNPSEQLKRPYCTECFDPCKTFGKVYHGDKRGTITKDCMSYKFYPSQICVISKIQGDFREKTRAALGKSTEKIKNSCCVPEGHIYGDALIIHEHGLGDLIRDCEPCPKKKELYECIAHFNGLRKILKKREINFYDLINFIKIADPNNKGIIVQETLFRLLANQNIIINQNKVKILLEFFDLIDEQQNVQYVDFIDLLDIRNPFPKLGKIQDVPPENRHYETTYISFLNDHFTHPVDKTMKRSGLPSKRYDLTYPKKLSNGVKADTEMLMDETNVESLISPSISTIYGLSHRDYFLPRTKDEIYQIFTNIGVNLESQEYFNEQWNKCVKIDGHSDDLVCVDTFQKQISMLQN